jgi:tetratricopeptide (TPR) repeat protein
MEFESMNNGDVEEKNNTNTAGVAQAMINELKAEPPKKPNHLLEKAKALGIKLGKSALFVGKRKFITIPLLSVALIAVIAVPILILTGVFHASEPLNDDLSPFYAEIIELREDKWYLDTYYEIQDLVATNKVDDALDLIDKKIAAEPNEVKKSILIGEKSFVAANDGRYDLAITAAEEQIQIYEAHGENLESNYGYLAYVFELSGDANKAIEFYRKAIDNAAPDSLDTGFYEAKIVSLKEGE